MKCITVIENITVIMLVLSIVWPIEKLIFSQICFHDY
jgi:hypothetical protein